MFKHTYFLFAKHDRTLCISSHVSPMVDILVRSPPKILLGKDIMC